MNFFLRCVVLMLVLTFGPMVVCFIVALIATLFSGDKND